jgi:hypothetical protein
MNDWIRIEVTEKEVGCGKAIITEYIDFEQVVRRDTEIIVDPDKLPKIGAEVNLYGNRASDNG